MVLEMTEEELFDFFRNLLAESYDYEETLRQNKITQEDVDKMVEFSKASEHIPCAILYKQILPVLVAVNNDYERACRLITTYYKFKRDSPEFFANRDVNSKEVQSALDNQNFAILPPTPKNCNLVFHNLANSDPKNYVFDEAEKVFLMTVGKAC